MKCVEKVHLVVLKISDSRNIVFCFKGILHKSLITMAALLEGKYLQNSQQYAYFGMRQVNPSLTIENLPVKTLAVISFNVCL